MRNHKTELEKICSEYDVDVIVDNLGAIVFYKNTLESDVIPFDDGVDKSYFIEHFEMSIDMSKLQLNLHASSL